jgi:hypothetical protein
MKGIKQPDAVTLNPGDQLTVGRITFNVPSAPQSHEATEVTAMRAALERWRQWCRLVFTNGSAQDIADAPDELLQSLACERFDAELHDLRSQVRATEEAEARCCPEDVGFEEYIGVLRKKLTERQHDLDYHADCRPNRRQAEAWRDDAKAMNDKWADTEKARREVNDRLSAVLIAIGALPRFAMMRQDLNYEPVQALQLDLGPTREAIIDAEEDQWIRVRDLHEAIASKAALKPVDQVTAERQQTERS